jgi:hypothetical protein
LTVRKISARALIVGIASAMARWKASIKAAHDIEKLKAALCMPAENMPGKSSFGAA